MLQSSGNQALLYVKTVNLLVMERVHLGGY